MDSRLKVYCPQNKFDNIFSDYHANGEIFEFEKEFFKLESDISKCDIVPVLLETYHYTEVLDNIINQKIQSLLHIGVTTQKLLLLNIFHIDICINDIYSYKHILKKFNQVFPDNQVVIVHTNKAYEGQIYYDFLWNRQKAYMTDYNKFDLWDRLYTRSADISVFGLRKIKKIKNHNNEIKKFLCPNRIYCDNNGGIIQHPRLLYREKLKHVISSEDFKDYSYTSDPFNGHILPTTSTLVNDYLIQSRGSGGWYPIDNNFYESSFISVYVETITSRHLGHEVPWNFEYRSITEKTWDPLIKGHYILPFGYQNMIDDIKNYGFRLPTWIDYSYDNIRNDDERFARFIDILREINKIPVNILEKHFENDYELIQSNRNRFWERSYDTLYHKIKKHFNL